MADNTQHTLKELAEMTEKEIQAAIEKLNKDTEALKQCLAELTQSPSSTSTAS